MLIYCDVLDVRKLKYEEPAIKSLLQVVKLILYINSWEKKILLREVKRKYCCGLLI